MARRRVLAASLALVGSLALAGCIVSPPPLAPVAPATQPPSSQPTTAPSTSDPAPSPTTSDPASPAPAADGLSVSMDGNAVPDDVLASLQCTFLGTGALLTTGEETEDVVLGFFTQEGSAWTASGFLVAIGTRQFAQRDESAPATYEGGVLSATVPMEDLGLGGEATLQLSVPCA